MIENEKIIKNLQEQLDAQQSMFIETNNYLARLKSELELEVQARTKELADANHELMTMLYRISHDFSSPVVSLKGLLNIIKTFSSDPTFTVAIQKGSETLKKQENMFLKLNHYHLIKDLKAVGENVSINDLTMSVVDTLEKILPDIRNLTTLDIKEQLSFFTSTDLIKIILNSIIENAFIFSKGKAIQVSAEKEGKFLIMTISDKGEGIAESSAKKIYEMFYRGSVLSIGNGLGLFIVKSAITKLKGEIKFETMPTGGTIFSFKIPEIS